MHKEAFTFIWFRTKIYKDTDPIAEYKDFFQLKQTIINVISSQVLLSISTDFQL